MKTLIVVMGVSGSGKSTLAKALSQAKTWPFLEGDDFHPMSNVKKMAGGAPLTNDDRIAWIEAMTNAVNETPDSVVILSCSALNIFVRQRLKAGISATIIWVYLEVSRDELLRRLRSRRGHFMKETLLDSQLEAMSPPDDAVRINGDQNLEACLKQTLAVLTPLS